MIKKILCFFLLCFCFLDVLHAQPITVPGVVLPNPGTNRFATCLNTAPVITATLVGGNGSHVTGGKLICDDPCDTSAIDILISGLQWNQFPDQNWIHGIYVPPQAGILVIPSPTLPTFDPSYLFQPLGCTGACLPPPFGAGGNVAGGPGFYFVGGGQDCCPGGGSTMFNPCDNYGDGSKSCGVSFNFPFRIRICNTLIQGSGSNPTLLIKVRADSDGNTGCWLTADGKLNTILFTLALGPGCGPLYNPIPAATAPVRNCSSGSPNYSTTLTGGCGNGNPVTWWDAATGGNQIGAGSPFVYTPAAGACPLTTVYEQCCPPATICFSRKAVGIPACQPFSLVTIYKLDGDCANPNRIDSIKTLNGNGVITYTLNPGGSSNTTGVFPNLPLNNYTLTATDATGCTITPTAVTFTPTGTGGAFTPVISSTATSCPGINNGTITVVTTPAGTYTYVLDGILASSNTTGIFTAVSGGPHTVAITNSTAPPCTTNLSVTVGAGTALTGTSSVVPTSCNNATNGGMTGVPSVAGAYTYTINSTPANATGAATGVFTGLAAGTYIITFTSTASGCTGTVTNTIVAGPALTATASTTAAACPGVNNGSFTVTAPTGTAPFTYVINATPANTTGTASGVFTGLAGGLYILSFTDANGCTGTVNATVATSPALTGTSSVTATSCNNAANGGMTAVPSVALAYTYTINTTPANTTGAATGVFTGLAAGTYIITFTSTASGCTGTVTNTIVAGPALTATATTTAAACPGVNNGSFTVTAPTGTAPFTYTINATPTNTTGAASGVFTGLAGGIYIVSFTDANGCTGTSTATVATSAALTGTSTFTATSCNNATNGGMTGVPSVAGAYTYTINSTPANTTGAATGVFTGLAAGTYIITFTSTVSGCTGTVTNTIAAGPALTATATTTAAACPGVNNGSFTVTAPTGTAPFTYIINATPANTTGAASGVFTGLAGAAYIITFTDANGCSGTVNATVAQGAAITATSSFTNTSCNNATNGSMTVSSATGTAPYSYSINATPANTTGAATGVFTGLAPGTYIISFADANSCTGTTTKTIAAGPALIATASTSSTACPGINTGTFSASSPTGTAPFNYTINATPANTTGATSGVFTGLAAGTYLISFTDATGCTGTSSATVAQGAAITATSSFTNTSCNNATNGSMTVSSATGTAPYSYSINATPANTTGAATGVFTGLAAGTYIISFTDANGCTGTTTKTIVAGPALIATASTSSTACPGINNGTFTATAPTGTAPFTYTINATPANTTGAASGVFTGLAAGPYIISFTDATGCTGTSTGVVAQGAALTATQIVANPNCAGINDGTFTAAPTNGAAPFTYVINATPANTTGAANGTFTGLAPGAYIITFTDASGCTGTQAATLTTNAPVTATETHTNATCFGNADGTITITAGGGVAPYTYALLPSTSFQTSNIITGVGSGTYTIRVKDNFDCIKDITSTITQPTLLTATAGKRNNATCNGNDGGIYVTGNGGTAPYQYSIDNGITYQTADTFRTVVNATYNNIIVKDANGCTATANSVIVGQDNNLTLDILTSPDTLICQGDNIRFTPATNAAAISTYSWTSLTGGVPNNTIDSLFTLNTSVHPVDTVIYQLILNYKACSITDVVKVNVLWKPVVDAGATVSVCRGDSILIMGTITHFSKRIDSLAWTPLDSLTSPKAIQTFVHPQKSTYYYLTAYTFKNTYGCDFAVHDSIKVVVPPDVKAFAGKDTIAVKGAAHQLLGSGGVSYTWSSPTVSIIDPYKQNPFVIINNDANFYLKVENSIGCADYDSVFVKVYDGPAYYVPNSFTPNGDGLNDVFRAIPVGIASTEYFKVMNRYGETIFQTNQYLKGWDGTFKGKKQPAGVYVWMIRGKNKDNKNVEMKGTVMLIQ